jgi:hypothetical protein
VSPFGRPVALYADSLFVSDATLAVEVRTASSGVAVVGQRAASPEEAVEEASNDGHAIRFRALFFLDSAL